MSFRRSRARSSSRRLALVALALTVAACAKGTRSTGDSSSTSASSAPAEAAFHPLRTGDTVPAYAAPTLAGDTVRVAAGGPLTLVNVWATWCTSCREEMADLEALHRDFGARGLRVVAVSVDEGDASRVRRFVEHEKLTMPIALDPAGRIQQLYSVVGVPETFLVGADGRLVWRQAGGLHDDPAAARAAVERAIGGAGASHAPGT
jgi:cytochrome c biogenesis protein CcmG, thiol:disulfide interchange protein DsbE